MKKKQNFKFIVLFALMLINITLYAYQNGDYRTVKNGYWEDFSVWQEYVNDRWIPNGIPDNNAQGAIYVKHKVMFTSYLTVIKKNMIIEENAILHASSHYIHEKRPDCSILFMGSYLGVYGQLGNYDESIALTVENHNNSSQYIIGLGRVILGYLEINAGDQTTYWGFNYSNIITGKLNSGNLILLDSSYDTEVIFNDLFIDKPNTLCNIQTKCVVKNSLYLGGGNNFDNAPTLKLTGNADLVLYDHDSNGEEVFKLGYNHKYANLLLEGSNNHNINIRSTENGYWNFQYYENPRDPYGFHNINISVYNTTFSNMEIEDLDTSYLVKIEHDKMVNCKFKYSKETSGDYSLLLD